MTLLEKVWKRSFYHETLKNTFSNNDVLFQFNGMAEGGGGGGGGGEG